MAMKASSIERIVRPGASLAAKARTSPGEPSARMRPASWMRKRSQYSASSMKWVVTTIVVPAAASFVRLRQKARRDARSAPEVASSRKRIFGW